MANKEERNKNEDLYKQREEDIRRRFKKPQKKLYEYPNEISNSLRRPIFQDLSVISTWENINHYIKHFTDGEVKDWCKFKFLKHSAKSASRALVDYQLIKYPVAFWMYDFFSDLDRNRNYYYTNPLRSKIINNEQAWLFKIATEGHSLFKECKNKTLPWNLNRKACHILLNLKDFKGTLYQAVRRAQFISAGADRRLSDIIKNITNLNSNNLLEPFIPTMAEWIVNNSNFLEPQRLVEIVDFLIYAKRQDPNYSLAGRTALSVLKATREWHIQLGKGKVAINKIFLTSGYKQYFPTEENLAGYSVVEILTAKELLEEGKKLRHCVYSYASIIDGIRASIWSLRFEGERLLTIQIHDKEIIQVAGKFNASAGDRELNIIRRWAKINGLKMGKYI